MIRKDGKTPLFDGLGSERTVTNSSGAVQGTLTPSAFGQTVASSGSSTSAYQFGATSGYRSEGDAGLTLVGCRFYDSQVGRFITRDTYLDQKPYAYCDGDPVNRLDPTGHSDLGFAEALLFVTIVIAVVIIAAPVAGPAFLVSLTGGWLLTAVGLLGGVVGEHLNDYLSELDKKRHEEESARPTPSAN